MKKAKAIIFCYENLEESKVPISEVHSYYFKNIQRNITSYNGSDIQEQNIAEEALIFLKPEAEKKAMSSFDDIRMEKQLSTTPLFERIGIWRDIVSIDILYEGTEKDKKEKRYEIYVPWEDEDNKGDTNKLISTFKQTNPMFNAEGCFAVHIGKTTTLKDEYLEEE